MFLEYGLPGVEAVLVLGKEAVDLGGTEHAVDDGGRDGCPLVVVC